MVQVQRQCRGFAEVRRCRVAEVNNSRIAEMLLKYTEMVQRWCRGGEEIKRWRSCRGGAEVQVQRCWCRGGAEVHDRGGAEI